MRNIVTYFTIHRIGWNWGAVAVVPLLVFSVFLLLSGGNPLTIYSSILQSTFGDAYGLGEVVIKTTPFILTALASSLAAKAGMVNVGGEGQLVIGALFTTAVAVWLVPHAPGWIGIPILVLAGMIGGGLWAGISAFLKVKANMNETITTMLLNYVAVFLVSLMVHGSLKDPAYFNWPFSPPIADALRLPTWPHSRVHIGIFIAVAAAFAVWFITVKSRLGFRLQVISQNPQAARQAGFQVAKTQFWILIAAGALAGIAGMIEITGIEGRLQATTGASYGYIGFLAAWMAWNNPLWLIATAFIIGTIDVSGNTLEMTSNLPHSSVNILMSLVLMAVLAFGRRKSK